MHATYSKRLTKRLTTRAVCIAAVFGFASYAAADELLSLCLESDLPANTCHCIDRDATSGDVRLIVIDSLKKGEPLQDPNAHKLVSKCRLLEA